MRIPINKDIEEAYKDDFFRGFTLRETIYIIIAFAVIVGTTFFMYKMFGINLSVGVYIGAPLGFPFIFLGFYKFQGLTPGEYLREKLYRRKTAELLYDADELPERRKEFYIVRPKMKRRRNR